MGITTTGQGNSDRIINILWISHHDMTSGMIDALSDYILQNFNSNNFCVRKYDGAFETLSEDITHDVDLFCIEGKPRFISSLIKNKQEIPVAQCEKGYTPDSWTWVTLDPAREKKMGTVTYVIVACAAFLSLTAVASFFVNRSDAKSVLLHNLEQKYDSAVELIDFDHIENDIYLARCYSGNKEFNAYLYYDSSTVRVDEDSFIDVPEGIEH